MIYFAWVLAFAGAILSFYFGEIQGLEPCRLCWYQRMCLFPLVVMLGMAVYRGDREIWIYGAPFAVSGGLLAVYQIAEPHLPIGGRMCGAGGCADPVFMWGGFVTLPLLSAVGFALIAFCLFKSK